MPISVPLDNTERTPEQMEKVLAAIRDAWAKHPSFGLGQLLVGALYLVGEQLDIDKIFYANDQDFIDNLARHDERVRNETELEMWKRQPQ